MTSPAPLRRTGRTLLGVIVCLVGLLGSVAVPTHAQRRGETFGLGVQVGEPSGLSLKFRRSASRAYDGTLTTDGDDFVRVALYGLRERSLPDSLMRLYYGVGVAAGGRHLDVAPTTEAALSTKIGLNFFAERLEVYLQATPTLQVYPTLTPTLGGSVGLRYHFRLH